MPDSDHLTSDSRGLQVTAPASCAVGVETSDGVERGMVMAIKALAHHFDGCTTQLTTMNGDVHTINISEVIRSDGMRVVRAYAVDVCRGGQ